MCLDHIIVIRFEKYYDYRNNEILSIPSFWQNSQINDFLCLTETLLRPGKIRSVALRAEGSGPEQDPGPDSAKCKCRSRVTFVYSKLLIPSSSVLLWSWFSPGQVRAMGQASVWSTVRSVEYWEVQSRRNSWSAWLRSVSSPGPGSDPVWFTTKPTPAVCVK